MMRLEHSKLENPFGGYSNRIIAAVDDMVEAIAYAKMHVSDVGDGDTISIIDTDSGEPLFEVVQRGGGV